MHSSEPTHEATHSKVTFWMGFFEGFFFRTGSKHLLFVSYFPHREYLSSRLAGFDRVNRIYQHMRTRAKHQCGQLEIESGTFWTGFRRFASWSIFFGPSPRTCVSFDGFWLSFRICYLSTNTCTHTHTHINVMQLELGSVKKGCLVFFF